MIIDRASGILMHITSLPGGYGIGDLGPEAYRWVDFLFESGFKYWQVLPLGPTGYGDSPYQSFSAIAGNHYLISPDLLLEDGLLFPKDLERIPEFAEEKIDFGSLIPWKLKLLETSYQNFLNTRTLEVEFEKFVIQEKDWLEDYALFMAIKESQRQASWVLWPKGLRDREEKSIEEFISMNSNTIKKHKFFQFIFFRQWNALRNYAISKKIKIVGDLPIYVAHDSVDVWANPEMYALLADCNPAKMAGVPPDYFSPQGQLWGNPIYCWDKHEASGFSWWIQRVSKIIEMVDLIRLDHFRGFAGYWEILAGNETAEQGEWVKGPGEVFFSTLKNHFGELPFIAEDLGEITPDVIELRDQFGFPGMRIMQFAFNGEENHPFLPHTYPEYTVAYSGTHDNESIMGWFETVGKWERDNALKYLEKFNLDLPWSMMESLWQSAASLVFIQMQDALGLGADSRMNFPSTSQGNWTWRMKSNAINEELSRKLNKLNLNCQR